MALTPSEVREILRDDPGSHWHVAGTPVDAEIERSWDESRIDHVWITLKIAGFGSLRGVVATWSRRSSVAGFDSRIRLGFARVHPASMHPQGVFRSSGLDYDELEKRFNFFYEHRTKKQMEKILLEEVRAADFIEIWGRLYARHHIGIHEVHSMRASCAVPAEETGRDGAIVFHQSHEASAKWVLLKFCGQP